MLSGRLLDHGSNSSRNLISLELSFMCFGSSVSSSEEMLQRNNEIPRDVVDTVSFRIKWEFRKERYRFGDCHRIWIREKELYREYGYEWYSPQEVYPNAKFD